jgi:hypothetical protein
MVDSPSMPPGMSAEAKKREQESRDEDDHRQLTRAEEIREDKSRMAGVLRHHRKQMRAVQRMSRTFGAR